MCKEQKTTNSDNKKGKLLAQSLHSLDKRTKSQTRSKSGQEPAMERTQLVQAAELALSKRAHTSNRVSASIAYRPWSDEWRLRVSPEFIGGALPPLQSGSRYTKKMTQSAVSKVEDSALYVDKEYGGYSVFATITLNEEARARVNNRITTFELVTYPYSGYTRYQSNHPRSAGLHFAIGIDHFGTLPLDSGDYCPIRYEKIDQELLDFIGPTVRRQHEYESSVQREVSRFFDGIKKMRLRGWVPQYQRGRKVANRKNGPYTPIDYNLSMKKMAGSEKNDSPFCYLWVAENPKNDEGKDNLHVHLLMAWSVPYRLFPCWAKRIERLWGQGYVHLEKIKDTKCSAYYLSKAAQYLSKGQKNNEQGVIRGNRYAISKPARAPGWESVGRYTANGLGYLIMLAKVKHKEKYGLLSITRREIVEQAKASKEKKTTKYNNLKSLAYHIGGRIRSIPSIFGRYNCIFKGSDTFDKFIDWCCKAGWSMGQPPDAYHVETIKKRVLNYLSQRELFDINQNYQFDIDGLSSAYELFAFNSKRQKLYLEEYLSWSVS